MTQTFDQDFWERHWEQRPSGSTAALPANPYVGRETAELPPGTALDAGCGGGAEAIWLATRGWQVTAADISARALAGARERAAASGVGEDIRWVEADLSHWEPDSRFELVMTNYAHPDMPQLEFYARIAEWVAPGGSLLIVGHLHGGDSAHSHGHGTHGHGADGEAGEASGHQPSAEASATAAGITARLDPDDWEVVTAEELARTVRVGEGRAVSLRDVVVRAIRRM
ncbi:class I SAM-dependent methyltransferase [Nocardia sp. NPDC057668]|uniref:class I SAM-dependent methyltransferase n=1 Tax=Nocardia sp. NPDC057668 TaxID=3346202 RepID=UPI00366CE82C